MMERLRALLGSKLVPVALFVVLAGAAVMLANGEAGEQVAADADVIVQTETVVRSATIAHSSAGDATLLVQAWELGAIDREQLQAAVDALRENVLSLEEAVGSLLVMIEDEEGVSAALESFQARAGTIASAVDSGDAGTALAAGDGLDLAYEGLTSAASAVSTTYRARLDAVREGLGGVVTAARFVVGLIIPAVTLLFLYFGLRRRQREAVMIGELNREKALRRKKDQFLAGAAHQINTPLSVVLGFAEMLRSNGRDYNAAVRTEMTELLAIQAAEASHVVEDILIAGRADMGELSLQETSIDLRSVLESVTRDWSGDHRARLTITGNGVATGDLKRVSQVLRNLLRNAVVHAGPTSASRSARYSTRSSLR